MDDTGLVALEEAAELLGITRGKVRDYLGAGKLHGYKVRVSHSPKPGCHCEWISVTWDSIEAYKAQRAKAVKRAGDSDCPECGLPDTGGQVCELCAATKAGETYWWKRDLEPRCSSSMWARCTAAVQV